jgi:hypothetical protein
MMKKPQLFAVPTVLLVLALYACAINPYATSETPEQYALATYKAGAALVHVAVGISKDSDIDAKVRDQVKEAALKLEAPLAQLHDTAIAVEKAKADLSTGAGTEEQLRIALEKLAAANSEASTGLDHLTEALP